MARAAARAAMLAAVKAISVAAGVFVASLSTGPLEKSFRSSDSAAGRKKKGCARSSSNSPLIDLALGCRRAVLVEGEA